MKYKIYRHSFSKDGKVFHGIWYRTIDKAKEEESKYVELSKKYHYVKSLGIEESEIMFSEKDLITLYDDYKKAIKDEVDKIISNSFYGWKMAYLFGDDMVSLAESLPEPKDGVDLYDEINKIIGE